MITKYIGVDLGGTTTKFAILDDDHCIVEKWDIKTDTTDHGSKILPSMLLSIESYLKKNKVNIEDLAGIGIGSPGIVDSYNGTVYGAYNLNWKEKTNVKYYFKKNLDLRVEIDNDANVATLGEQMKGSGNKQSNLVFITLGTGVGGGLVINGNLVRGNNYSAGEIGHITVDPDGLRCTCGKFGCLETVASATGLVSLAKNNLKENTEYSSLKKLIEDRLQITAKDIFDFAKKNDPYAEYILDRFGNYLGLACSHLANTLNPSQIIIGGGVSNAGSIIINTIQPYFDRYSLPNIKNNTSISLATLGNESGVIGASFLLD